MPEKRNYQTPLILHDGPLSNKDDAAFHFDDFAATFARLVADKSTRTPLTIGINGAWGSGKTTLLRRIEKMLTETFALFSSTDPAILSFANDIENPQIEFRTCRTIWFNAWKYADEDKLLVALMRVIVQEMFRDNFISRSAATLFEPFSDRRDVINTVLSWFSIKLGDAEAGLNTGEPKQTVFTEKMALLDQFNDVFDRLLVAWTNHSLVTREVNPEKGILVVFIDDLDRCLPAKTVQVLEAIKLFMDKEGCIFILGADMNLIHKAVIKYYIDAGLTAEGAKDYVEKIIQVRFNLPPVIADSMQDYLKTQPVTEGMLMQWQTLIAAAEINPRRVKAVINDVEVQWNMMINCGQAEGVRQDDFIRWSALTRAAPDNFRERLADIDDLDLRLKFVQDALMWGGGNGDENLARQFQEYEKDSRRLRRVLREIKAFSVDFDAKALDAFMHLSAPPKKALPVESTPQKSTESPPIKPVETILEVQSAETIETTEEVGIKSAVTRGENTSSSDAKRMTISGIEFVKIPAGKFIMGSKDDNPLARDNEKFQHIVEIAQDYWMARFPLTNHSFEFFVKASGYQTQAEKQGSAYAFDGNSWNSTKGANWQHPRGPESDLNGREDHPVVSVGWSDALAYCQWFNQQYRVELKNLTLRLPTEAEWEKAARGEYGNEWPWGKEEPDAKRCNFSMDIKDTTPVGQYSPQGDSPYGCADMAGNVWERTHSLLQPYPYKADDGREDEKASGQPRVVRGGAFFRSRQFVRCACRSSDVFLGSDVGFRVVAAPGLS